MGHPASYRKPAGQPAPRLPDFMIIGAAKSGTTALAHHLSQHPGVYFSPYKEPNYFALANHALPQGGPAPSNVLFELLHRHSVTDFDTYCSLFESAGTLSAGEASVRYLYYPEAPAHIHESVPDVRLIAILRDPVDRLYSHYCMNVQHQLEPLGLREALAQESTRISQGWGWDWHYCGLGQYARQLKRYYALFPPEQLKVFLYEEFVTDPQRVFREVCEYLGIDPAFCPDRSRRQKAAYRPRSRTVDRWLHWPNDARSTVEAMLPGGVYRRVLSGLRQLNSGPVPVLDPKLRRELAPRFQEDGQELSDLLARRIPWACPGL